MWTVQIKIIIIIGLRPRWITFSSTCRILHILLSLIQSLLNIISGPLWILYCARIVPAGTISSQYFPVYSYRQHRPTVSKGLFIKSGYRYLASFQFPLLTFRCVHIRRRASLATELSQPQPGWKFSHMITQALVTGRKFLDKIVSLSRHSGQKGIISTLCVHPLTQFMRRSPKKLIPPSKHASVKRFARLGANLDPDSGAFPRSARKTANTIENADTIVYIFLFKVNYTK